MEKEKILAKIYERPIPEWFQEAKFGIFIHWGPYSVPAYKSVNDELFGSYAEWYYATVYGTHKNNGDDFHRRVYGEEFEYRDFGKHFNAELFYPESLAHIMKASGAKYVVLTAKHHDGYCLWPTENHHKKDWNAMTVGPERDLVGELKEAVEAEGMRFGLYYSMIDWESVPSHRCDGGYFIPEKDVEKYGLSKEDYLKDVLHPDLYELVNKYTPSLLFADGGEWDLTIEESGVLEFLPWLYNESPVKDEVVVNDRFFKGMPEHFGDYYSTEYNDKQVQDHPWEESRGIGKSYGYNRMQHLNDYLTPQEVIAKLVQVVAKGGNLLLNISPKADGTLSIYEENVLDIVGQWLDIYGEAIFETHPNPNCPEHLVSTQKGERDYLFIQKEEMKHLPLYLEQFAPDNAHVKLLGTTLSCKAQEVIANLQQSLDLSVTVGELLGKYGTIVIKKSHQLS
ncbi:alpha-L-fucosidase [Allofustis seminis]|uniref:alpha-L-fucosidase n=1 Tax=Allofustis seminis TaxID=166939 RepID=UPI0003785A3D|nr:alpha-L-fucosidase [Allofustis seminis]